MNEYQTYQSVVDLINFLIGIQLFIGFAFIIQFIANIVIISQLPKIKRYERLLYLKAYGFENDDNEDEKEDKKTRYNYKFVKNVEEKIKENIEQEEELNRQLESLTKEDIEKIIMWLLIGIIIIIILLKMIL